MFFHRTDRSGCSCRKWSKCVCRATRQKQENKASKVVDAVAKGIPGAVSCISGTLCRQKSVPPGNKWWSRTKVIKTKFSNLHGSFCLIDMHKRTEVKIQYRQSYVTGRCNAAYDLRRTRSGIGRVRQVEINPGQFFLLQNYCRSRFLVTTANLNSRGSLIMERYMRIQILVNMVTVDLSH